MKKEGGQGDTILLKLFIASLESIFSKLNLEIKGININGECNNPRFVDGMILTLEMAEELQDLLMDLSRERLKTGLKMNRSKTKGMFNTYAHRNVINTEGEIFKEINIATGVKN